MSAPRRLEIDGLRAIAVLLVVAYHAHLGMPGGYVGVDVFFVISGYLITGIILREQDAGAFSLGNFWLRRIRRIMPAALVVTSVVLVVGLFLLPPSGLDDVAKAALSQQLLSSNFYFWLTSGYWGTPAEMQPLLHTWSLGVEEQFYLILPLLLLLACRLPRRWLGALLALIFAVSLAHCVDASYRSGLRGYNYFLLPTRAWELLAGSLLAMVPVARLPRWICEGAAAVGLVAIFAAGLMLTDHSRFPGLLALPPVLGTAAVIYATGQRFTFAGWLLSVRPMALIGAASYSIYLWHEPLLVYTRVWLSQQYLPVEYSVGAAIAGLVVGIVSWRVVEEPIRLRRVLTDNRQLVGVAAACAFGLAVASASVVSNWMVFASQPPVVVAREEYDLIGGYPIRALGSPNPHRPARILFWGDSHTEAIQFFCHNLAIEYDEKIYVAAAGGYVPLLEVHANFKLLPEAKMQWRRSQVVVDFIVDKKIQHVILCCHWTGRLGLRDGQYRADGETIDEVMGDKEAENPTIEQTRRVFREGLLRTHRALHSTGVKISLLQTVPIQPAKVPEMVADARRKNILPRGVSRVNHENQLAPVNRILGELDLPGMKVFGPLDDWYDANGFSKIFDGKNPLYLDTNHLNTAGAEVYWRKHLETIFQE